MDLLALIEQATRAPSSHNTQPWRFRLRADAVELHADRDRALPVNDPDDRELTISCGTALFNLEAAAARAGLGTKTTLFPDSGATDCFATVIVAGPADPARARLGAFIESRRSTRAAFDGRPVPERFASTLETLPEGHEGVWLRVVPPASREPLAELVAAGDRRQFADPEWRRELAHWMHPRGSVDGLPAPGLAGALSRIAVRNLDLGRPTARQDLRLAARAPLLVALGSDRDDPGSWLETGRILQRLLLEATADGLQAGYLNQPCQVRELRGQLQDLLASPGPAQLLLRLGHRPGPCRPGPRRPVREVLLPARG